MLSVAIVGTGPAGCYTAEALLKRLGGVVAIDLIDRLPTPFGLVRAGVAPDHQSIKAVSRRFEKAAAAPGVRLVGNVEVGRDVALAELRDLYDAVVLAVGAPVDRALGVAGEDLPGVVGSGAFVGWYNGHPDWAGLQVPLAHPGVVIVGNGNVALDCARILAKTPGELAASDVAAHARAALARSGVRAIAILGRRGPHEAAFSRQELAEMGELERAAAVIDPAAFPSVEADAALESGRRKVVSVLRALAERPRAEAEVTIEFRFFARPVAIEGDGRVERVIVERTRLEGARAVGTGETSVLNAGLVIPCIGYAAAPLESAPFDEGAGRFANDGGVVVPGLYAAGWARRGPTGTIGTNKDDGDQAAALIAAAGAGAGKPGGTGLDALLAARGVRATTLADWRALDAAEVERATGGAPREKFVVVAEMLARVGG